VRPCNRNIVETLRDYLNASLRPSYMAGTWFTKARTCFALKWTPAHPLCHRRTGRPALRRLPRVEALLHQPSLTQGANPEGSNAACPPPDPKLTMASTDAPNSTTWGDARSSPFRPFWTAGPTRKERHFARPGPMAIKAH